MDEDTESVRIRPHQTHPTLRRFRWARPGRIPASARQQARLRARVDARLLHCVAPPRVALAVSTSASSTVEDPAPLPQCCSATRRRGECNPSRSTTASRNENELCDRAAPAAQHAQVMNANRSAGYTLPIIMSHALEVASKLLRLHILQRFLPSSVYKVRLHLGRGIMRPPGSRAYMSAGARDRGEERTGRRGGELPHAQDVLE